MADVIKCFPVELSDEQSANLAKLAAYLWTLPANYPDFEMSDFVSGISFDDVEANYAHVCGTAACAVGHGPKAGITPLQDERWREYSERVFISCDPDAHDDEDNEGPWEWCFGAGWAWRDNTVHGAAARIEWMLAHGVPTNWSQQKRGVDPICYSIQRPSS